MDEERLPRRPGGTELPGVRILFILATGRSGSMFLHSLFDSHPQVLSYPAIHGIYSPLFPGDCIVTIDDAVEYLQVLTRLHIHFQNGYDEAVGRLGADGRESLSVDPERFLPLFREELAGAGPHITRRDIVLGVHRAWGRYSGASPSTPRLLVEHVHNPAMVGAALADFPEAYCIQTVREPCAGYYAMVDFCWKAYGHFKSMFFFKFTKNVFVDPWEELEAPTWPFLPGRHRTLRLEDLNARGEPVMREIADWLGIDFDESLTRSSVGGLTCLGNSGTAAVVSGFRGSAPSASAGSGPSRIERLRIETLVRRPMERLGYTPTTMDTRLSRLAGLLALLVPIRSEFRLAPRGLYRDTLKDHASFPLDRALLFLLRHRSPGLARALRAVGVDRAGSLAARVFASSLVWTLFLERLLFEPVRSYVLRVCLFVGRFSRLVRSRPSAGPPALGRAAPESIGTGLP